MLAASTIALTLSMMGLVTPGNTPGGRDWCAKMRGSLRCAYATEQQCRASAGGGGTCVHRPSSARRQYAIDLLTTPRRQRCQPILIEGFQSR
nr:DUF3551 domain-containing protein [Bradyrhizobium elkanii]